MIVGGDVGSQTLIEAAQESVGLEGVETARLEIWVWGNDYLLKAEQLKRLDGYLEEKVKEVPNVEKLLVIKGVGLSTVTGFVAEVGDIGRFTDRKQSNQKSTYCSRQRPPRVQLVLDYRSAL